MIPSQTYHTIILLSESETEEPDVFAAVTTFPLYSSAFPHIPLLSIQVPRGYLVDVRPPVGSQAAALNYHIQSVPEGVTNPPSLELSLSFTGTSEPIDFDFYLDDFGALERFQAERAVGSNILGIEIEL